MIIESIGIGIVAVLLIAWGGLEWTHRRRQGNALDALPGNWQFESREPQHYQLVGSKPFLTPPVS